jgi:hypothetical protein
VSARKIVRFGCFVELVKFDDIGAEYYGGFSADPHDTTDPGFESGGWWSNWANTTGTAVRGADGSAHGGSYVLSVENNHLADGYAQSQTISVTAGETYRFRSWVKQEIDSGGAVSHRLAFYNSGGGLIKRITLSGWAKQLPVAWSLTNGWELFSGLAVAPTGATSVRLEVAAGQLDGYVFFDHVTRFTERTPGEAVLPTTCRQKYGCYLVSLSCTLPFCSQPVRLPHL